MLDEIRFDLHVKKLCWNSYFGDNVVLHCKPIFAFQFVSVLVCVWIDFPVNTAIDEVVIKLSCRLNETYFWTVLFHRETGFKLLLNKRT